MSLKRRIEEDAMGEACIVQITVIESRENEHQPADARILYLEGRYLFNTDSDSMCNIRSAGGVGGHSVL